jgi:polygalacturonase
MAKLTLNTIGSRYGSIDALNDNFDAIEQALENTFSLDGTSPNALEADLDMNSNDILNAGEVSTETLRINGVLVQPTTGVTAGAAFQTYSYTATAGQTTFSVTPATPFNASIVVIVNGLQLSPSEISVSGTNVITPALTLGDEVVIRRYTAEPVAAPDASEVNFIQAGTGAVTRTSQNKMRDVVSVKDFGAVGDGVIDDTAAIQAAIAAANGGALVLPPSSGSYLVRSKLTIASAIDIFGYGATILFDFPVATSNANGRLFDIAASNVSFNGLTIDATGITGTITGVNRYAIAVDPSGATRYNNISFRDCRFTNLTQYSGTIPATTTVMHVIYAKQADNLLVRDCVFNTISGSPIYLIDTERAKIIDNDFIAFGWTGVWLNNANKYWEIRGNTFSGTTLAAPSYWGGAIDVMGQTSDAAAPGEPDEHGVISDNKFIGGVYRYGAVLRLASSRHVVISDNLFDQCDADLDTTPGGGGSGSQNNCITLSVRDVTINNGPHKNIIISDNVFVAKGAGWQKGIYALTGTSAGGADNTTACEGLTITNNIFHCPDASNYFLSCVVVHGLKAGYRDILITGNNMKAIPQTTPNYQPGSIPGIVNVITNVGTTVDRLTVKSNHLEHFNGSGTTNNHIGVNVRDYVPDPVIEGNTFKNNYRCIEIASGAVPILRNLFQPASSGSAFNMRGNVFTPSLGNFALRKTADQSLTSQTTLQNCTGMVFPIGPNEEVFAEFFAPIGANLFTTGFKAGITTPSGATQEIGAEIQPDLITGATRALYLRTTTSGAELDFTAANMTGISFGLLRVSVWILNGSTAGNVQLQFAQSTSSATALTIRKGAAINADRVA